MQFARCIFKVIVLVAILLIASCGPKSNETRTAPKAVNLPEFLGVYLLDGDRLIRLQENDSESTPSKISGKAALIVYDKKAGLPDADKAMALARMQFIRKRIQDRSDGGLDVEEIQKWQQHSGIQLLVKPLDKPDMLMLVPSTTLDDAVYEFKAFGARYSFAVGGGGSHIDIWNAQPLRSDSVDQMIAEEVGKILVADSAVVRADRLSQLLGLLGDDVGKPLRAKVAGAWRKSIDRAIAGQSHLNILPGYFPEPEGFKAMSRWLSEATPPDHAARTPHPGRGARIAATPPGSALFFIVSGGIADSTPG